MTRYPFTALVGQEPLKTALVLNAIDPSLGGVLICGEKGTAKTTAARGLVDLLPTLQVRTGCPYQTAPDDPWTMPAADSDCSLAGGGLPAVEEITVPFVELPLGATEDRVVGTLDLAVALRERRQVFHPGLLAAANRGILYVDEINLLADHLVDLLLDAAASGTNIVEREGIEVVHPARFLLIGTMNPEEGQLRPQLLDRFGLMVNVAAPRDPAIRVDVVRRRMAFESDPAGFCVQWQPQQDALRHTIARARNRLLQVAIADQMLHLICQICCEMQVDGLRADITMHKAAKALAAFDDRTEVTVHDVRQAAELALPHRRRRQPFEKPGLDQQQLDDLLPRSADSPGMTGDKQQSPSSFELDQQQPDEPTPAATDPPANSDDGQQSSSPDSQTVTYAAKPNTPAPPLQFAPARGSTPATPGRRNPTSQSHSGRFVRAVPDPEPTSLAVRQTLRSAALNGLCPKMGSDPQPQGDRQNINLSGKGSDPIFGQSPLNETGEIGPLTVRPQDLHQALRSGESGTLILFVVDASGSMAARRRMEAVKGAVLSLLVDAYQQRDRVCVIAFRGPCADLLLPPTNSLDLARDALDQLPTGGRTPLAHALMLATEIVRRERRSAADLPVFAVILTDGHANVPLPGQDGSPWEQAICAASLLADAAVATLVLDTDQQFVQVGRARELADVLGAEYQPLEQLSADSLALEVRQRRRTEFQSAHTEKAMP